MKWSHTFFLSIGQDLKLVNSYLKSCFLIFPNYNLGHGLMEMAYNEYINEYYAKIGKKESGKISVHYLEWFGEKGTIPSNVNQVSFLSNCLMNLQMSIFYTLSGQFDKMKSPFEWDIVTRGLVAMTIEGFVGFFITIMCQYNFFRKPQ